MLRAISYYFSHNHVHILDIMEKRGQKWCEGKLFQPVHGKYSQSEEAVAQRTSF